MTIKDFCEKYGDIEIIEEQEKQIKEFLNIKENKRWKPKNGDFYYCVLTHNMIEKYIYYGNSLDLIFLSNGNCFKTKEEAEFRLEQIKVYNELKNFADDNNDEINWNNKSQEKFNISYDNTTKKILTGFVCWCKYVGEIYFSSRELAEQAIEKVGEDRIKKYLFEAE